MDHKTLFPVSEVGFVFGYPMKHAFCGGCSGKLYEISRHHVLQPFAYHYKSHHKRGCVIINGNDYRLSISYVTKRG